MNLKHVEHVLTNVYKSLHIEQSAKHCTNLYKIIQDYTFSSNVVQSCTIFYDVVQCRTILCKVVDKCRVSVFHVDLLLKTRQTYSNKMTCPICECLALGLFSPIYFSTLLYFMFGPTSVGWPVLIFPKFDHSG